MTRRQWAKWGLGISYGYLCLWVLSLLGNAWLVSQLKLSLLSSAGLDVLDDRVMREVACAEGLSLVAALVVYLVCLVVLVRTPRNP